MKHRCPKCGHKWESPSANQQAGGKARWKGKTKAQRKAAASAAAKARWEKASNAQADPRQSGLANGSASGD